MIIFLKKATFGCLFYFIKMRNHQESLRVQSWVLIIGLLLMIVKFATHIITGSNAILSDALESIINVAAGAFALYSIRLAGRPKDLNHPYGHGKIEFVSVGFEGGLIVLAAIYILFEAVHSFIVPNQIKSLDIGIWLTLGSGIVNLILALVLMHFGKKNNSNAMVADGNHLLTDTYTSVGLIVGLGLVYFTGLVWIDAFVALLMGAFILVTGLKLIRHSLSGLLDETDEVIIKDILVSLNKARKPEWVDVHNLRVVKHGANYHIDAHVTLPWYWSLERAHEELHQMEHIIDAQFPNETELFIHADPCIPSSCQVCILANCPERKADFSQQIKWDIASITNNKKHQLN